MARNHGMTRSLSVYNIDNSLYKNPDVNPLFDFNIVGNNFRNTDVHAFIGLLDFSRVDGYIKKRHKIYNQIVELLGKDNLILPKEFLERTAVPFCFPILSKDKNFIDKVLSFCREKGVETRPIISGNLLRQTCYKKYGDYKKFKNSEFLHQNGFYIGIFPSLKDSVINVFKKFK
jgi:CDP-6-deoxy-D-xylo-4-hexulose-3-dehydrase